MFRFPLQRFSATFLILRKTQLDIIKYILLLMQSNCYCCAILMDLNFIDCVSKNSQISNFREIRPVGAESFHADSRADKRRDMT